MPIVNRIEAKCDYCDKELDFDDISVGNQPYEVRVVRVNTGQGFTKVLCSFCYESIFLKAMKMASMYAEDMKEVEGSNELDQTDSTGQQSPA